MIQQFIDKENELALQGYAINHGKDIQIITAMNWKYQIPGYYSPYHDVFMFQNKNMEQKLKAFWAVYIHVRNYWLWEESGLR